MLEKIAGKAGFACCALAFIIGIAFLQRLPGLPSPAWYGLVPLCIALAIWRASWRLLAALVLGFFWAALSAELKLSRSLPDNMIGKDIVVVGQVVSIPESDQRRVRFDFLIEQHLHGSSAARIATPMRARISWYYRKESHVPVIKLGQQWQLKLRLKPAVGLLNPGAYDYEAWLFSRNLRATGYVRESAENQKIAAPAFSGAQLRASLLRQIATLSDGLPKQGILQALMLGYRANISDSDWDLLLRTGTNHLVAISGLHIGMIASLAYFLVLFGCGWWVRWTSVALIWPAQRIAACGAWGVAFIYAGLAGFSLPTQRALIMLSVGLVAIVAYRQLRLGQAFGLAALAVLILDPFALNQASFWLSFGAVAVLLYGVAGRRRDPQPRWRLTLAWVHIQWLLVIGLSPLSLYWFGGAALLAAGANIIAIPLIGFMVLPLALIALSLCFIWPAAAKTLLIAANTLLEWLWLLLEMMSVWPLARWEQNLPPLWAVSLATVGVLLLLLPRGLPGRWLGLCWLLPMLLYQPVRPAEAEFELTVLDVGQGTAVVIRTAKHVLVYDAGPRSGVRFDAGSLVVLPFLKKQGVTRVDTLLISHGDNDHIGGAPAVMANLPVARVLSSVPKALAQYGAQACVAGQTWHWDGVDFAVLHPDRSRRWEGNDSSCVLEIRVGSTRALLTGDIERRVENHLLATLNLPQYDFLLAPHHGSRSSSTAAFLQALQPVHVVFTAGMFNRYRFPKPDIVERYHRVNSTVWVSGERGALTFTANAQGFHFVQAYRQAGRRYWHYRPRFTVQRPASNSRKNKVSSRSDHQHQVALP